MELSFSYQHALNLYLRKKKIFVTLTDRRQTDYQTLQKWMEKYVDIYTNELWIDFLMLSKICLRKVHPMCWPWYIVLKVRGVNGGEGPSVHQEEVGLFLGAIKPNSDEDTIILASAISGGE